MQTTKGNRVISTIIMTTHVVDEVDNDRSSTDDDSLAPSATIVSDKIG